jgi:hypothetical protein
MNLQMLINKKLSFMRKDWFGLVMVFNATCNNISVLLVEETRENLAMSGVRTHNVSGDRH